MNRLFAALACALCAHLTQAATPVTPCESALSAPLAIQSSGWSHDLPQTRDIPAEQAGLSADDLPQLELLWAFAFEDTNQPRSLPAITEQAIFIGSQEGTLYALDRQTGCAYWQFKAGKHPIRTAVSVVNLNERSLVFFGNDDAHAFAVDASTGELVWQLEVDPHKDAVITGSPVYHDGFVYVPASSFEVGWAIKPWYSCCSFRGSISKLNALTGERVWQSFSIPEEPTPSVRNAIGIKQQGPSGAPIWSAPTIDTARNRLYFGTGQNYSTPSDHNSDAIHAIDLTTGERIWRTQFLAEDSWNPACNLWWLGGFNCPEEDGPDYDFGAPPILATLADGSTILLAGQKSGMVFGINPDTGETLWAQSVGRGGTLGGVHWGMAADNQHGYVPISDLTIWGIETPGEPKPALNKLDLATGETVWSTPAIFNCTDEDGDAIKGCRSGLSAAITLIPGAVFAPGLDGVLRAYSRDTGEVLWQYDTKQAYKGINGVKGEGGTLDAGGAVVAGGQLFINSGYGGIISAGSKGGNVFLVFGKKAAE